MLNPLLPHHPLAKKDGQPAFAVPYTPKEIDRRPACQSFQNHVPTLQEPMKAFRLEVREFGHA